MPTFGPAFEEALDGQRVRGSLDKLRDFMLGNLEWWTLSEISKRLNIPEASVSANLRHLRKPAFGSYVVEKRRREPTGGTWEYQVTLPVPSGQQKFQFTM